MRLTASTWRAGRRWTGRWWTPVGAPRALFAFDRKVLTIDCDPVRCYGVGRDGQTFYGNEAVPPEPQPPVTQINLIQNWVEELKAKVPSRSR